MPDAAWLSTLGRALASGALFIVPLSLDCQPGAHMFHVKRVCSCRRPCQAGSTSMCGPVSASALSAGSRKYIKILRTCALTGVVRFPGWSGEAAEASTTRFAYRGTGASQGGHPNKGRFAGGRQALPGYSRMGLTSEQELDCYWRAALRDCREKFHACPPRRLLEFWRQFWTFLDS